MTQSMLWAVLIIAWLVVLVPMLAARHPKINQVSDATLKTRLLHRGGSAKLALRRKIRPTAQAAEREEQGVRDEELTEDDEVLLRSQAATERETGPATEAEIAAEADTEITEIDAEAEAHAFVDSDVDGPCVASPMDGETTPIRTVRRADMLAEPVEVPAAEPVVDPVAAAEQVEAPEAVEVVEPAEDVEAAEAAEVESDEIAEVDSDEIAADETLTEEVAPVDRAAVERTDGARSRRGGFDPENDARITEARFRFRQRVTMVLGVLAVVALGAGLMNVPFAWYGLGAVVIALALYLTYLRRTVRIEAEIRRRRTARLERARRERAREAEEFDGVPAHRRRGGCIVMEIDDEDPAFDHLPRYRAEEFEFLQRPELREPMERKVG